MNALRLKGSSFDKTIEDNDYFEVGVRTEKDVLTSFEYLPSWPFHMEVSPSKGDSLVGDSITQQNPDLSKYMNLFFCMNNYHFVYDVQFPVLVSLSDESGFTFQFANLVVIDKNTPREYVGEILNYEIGGNLGEEFCDNKINRIEVRALDASNYNGISDVDISYSCMSSSCYLGKTGVSGEFNDKFPACINGRVFADREGYYSIPETLSTDVSSKVGILMEPYYDVDVEVKVVDLNTGLVRDLESEEEAVFQFRNLDNGYNTVIVSDSEDISLVAGEYEVTSYLMQEGKDIKIEGQTFVECVDVPRSGIVGLLGFKKEECFENEIEDSEVSEFMSGGAVFTFELSHSNLESVGKLILYGAHDGEPNDYSEMMRILSNIETNVNNINFKYPEII